MESVENDTERIGTAKDSVLGSIPSNSAIPLEVSASTQEIIESAEEKPSTLVDVVKTIEELERAIEELSSSGIYLNCRLDADCLNVLIE